jgi:hypothetical protein
MDESELAEFRPGMKSSDQRPGAENYRNYMRQYSAQYLLAPGAEEIPYFNYYAWPAPGYFPLQIWQYAEKLDMYPWSITLNPGDFRNQDPDAIRVEMADSRGRWRITLDKTTRLEAAGILRDADSDENGLKPFLQYLPQSPSWLPMIHFFPGQTRLPKANAGDRIRISVSGLKDANGKPAKKIEYWVEFFDLPNSEWLVD